MIKPFSFSLVLAACLFGGVTGSAQPYNPSIDVQHYDFSLDLNDSSNVIRGQAVLTVVFRADAAAGFQLDLTRKNETGKGMVVKKITENGAGVRFTQNVSELLFHISAKAGEQHIYSIVYEGVPADGLIISKNKFGNRGFFGDNWPNRAHNWLPCVDHPSDKATLDWRITAPEHYTVVANGALKEEKIIGGSRKLTHWQESVPLAPKVMMIGVSDFAVDHPGDAMGVPVMDYVYKENREVGFKSYSYALEILPFYIQHIGPFPYEKCGNVQSKTRFGGLENASAICYFENSVNSPDVESLMAHEIAHQWFGDAATESRWEYLWLSEGFATYMTHCYLENKYGADTLEKRMRKDREKVIAFEKKRQTPVIDSSVKTDFMTLLNPNSYEKGGWVLHMLRRRIGDELFWKGISTYYADYRNKNAASADFETVMSAVSGQDLHDFFHQWLEQPGHPVLRLSRSYDPDKKEFVLTFTQVGAGSWDFPLAYTVDGAPYSVNIRGASTTVRLPLAAEPRRVQIDPHVNTLASVAE